ncbi:hypothetical protein IHE45_09G088900 [Dioscorea alata]|uniref:Uncharacterized protein n=1 Tax=Dioscorea alata TaxID=55571 RepID=A0ACB7VGL2_DIOAL|nr:hypothetical protein IHE45_09G088900 [Dioscorea alata]
MMNRSPIGGRTLKGAMAKDKEEDLALFLEMRKRETLLLLHNTDEVERSEPGASHIFKIPPSAPPRKAGIEDFLNSDNDKNDYNWLLTPPGTPLFPSLEKESPRSPVGQVGNPKARPTVLKSRLAHPHEPSSTRVLASARPTSSSGLNSSGMASRRPSSSGGRSTTSSRPATPTGRPTIATATTKPSRPSTPTSRPTLPSKPLAQPPRSSTPSRSSTPTPRPAPTASRPASRASTPTRRASTPSATPSHAPTSSTIPGRSASSTIPGRSASSTVPSRSAAVTKSGQTVPKTSAPPSRGTSPTVKSRPWKPSEMPGFSLEAPVNLRTSMPERPSSASRGRPGVPSSRSAEPGPATRPRRQSCSPARGRAPNGTVQSGTSVPAVNRSRLNGGDNISPVMIGSKMVERVVNLRRLVPPKQDDLRSENNPRSSSSPDSTGFGRTLSKKSLDMALRHMDIRRSIPNNLRPLMTNIPASSMYSVRSGPTKSRTVSVSDSPLATSSNASSEPSVSNAIHSLDGIEFGNDDIGSEKGSRFSPGGSLTR